MSWTQKLITILDALGNPFPFLGYWDGTNSAFAHNVLDLNGSAISPAVSTGSVILTAAPAVQAAAYVSGNVVGNGIISLANATRIAGGSGLIQHVTIFTKNGPIAPFDVLFFTANPTNTTWTDKAALSFNSSDAANLLPTVHCSSDITSLGTPQQIQAFGLGIPFKLASGTTLYAAVVIRGSQTFLSISDLSMAVGVVQD